MEIIGQTKASIEEGSALCPYCGAGIPEEDRFCPACGYEKGSLATTAVQAERQAVAKLKAGDEEFELFEGEVIIGRTEGDILLRNPYLSRKHAKITVKNGKFFVTDLGSTNGTFVNGRRINPNEEVGIEPSAELKFGELKASITLVMMPEEATEEIAASVASEEKAPVEGQGSVEPAGLQEVQVSLAEVSSSWEIVAGDKKFPLPFGQVRIGRKPDRNDISFPEDRYVSGEHLLLEVDLEELKVKDLGSTNGTFVNGQRIEPGSFVSLSDGDEITIGKTVLRVGRFAPGVEQVRAEAEKPELPPKEKPAQSPGIPVPSEAEGLEEKEEDAQIPD